MSEQPGRRERKRERTRQTIADAAMTLFVERGFDRVTVADVAEEADVSVNTVYNHFPTKEDLFFAQAETSDRGLVDLVHGRARGEPVVDFFRRQVAEQIERVRAAAGEDARERHRRRQAIREILNASPALQVAAAHATRGIALAVEDAFTRALAEDVGADPSDIRPRLVASQVLGLLSTLCLDAERRRRAGQSADEVIAEFTTGAEAAIALLERGIGDYGVNVSHGAVKKRGSAEARRGRTARRDSV
jgi:AcrR family transcriptional regulator